jgi:uroporphyrin-III C-methyltransferase
MPVAIRGGSAVGESDGPSVGVVVHAGGKDVDAVQKVRRGKVWLVGAGPGNPDLLTLRAHRLIAGAQVVAHDELIPDEILAMAPSTAEIIPVGRRAKGAIHHRGRIHPVVVARALDGKDVVRLKGGDPFIFGRGGEEAEELARAGIVFEVVPGVSSALGAAASANIPLTHRECSSYVTFATGHDARDAGARFGWMATDGTLVVYMAFARLHETCAGLLAHGRAPGTPAAVVSRATLPGQKIVTGTLADIDARARAVGIEAPALLIVGEVVSHRVNVPPGDPSGSPSPAV